ncbi:MAG: hypothetical protein AAB319_06075, partial [Pseudomonadota bacterium]
METRVDTFEKAKELGATVLLGEDYGARPRMVLVAPAGWSDPAARCSLELCGGTHVSNTSEIGGFKILKESSVAAGSRRIEAVAGPALVDFLREARAGEARLLAELSQRVKDRLAELRNLGGAADEFSVDGRTIAELRSRDRNLADLLSSFREKELSITADAGKKIIEAGGKIAQETRLYDSDKDETRSMRSKEEAFDYRYFPDPDLLPMKISEAMIEEIQKTLPELQQAKHARFMHEFGLSSYDASVLTASKSMAAYFEQVVSQVGAAQAKAAANWVMGDLAGALKRDSLEIAHSPVSSDRLAGLVRRIADNTISSKIAKEVFEAMCNGEGDADAIIEAKGLKQITDTGAIEKIIDGIIA